MASAAWQLMLCGPPEMLPFAAMPMSQQHHSSRTRSAVIMPQKHAQLVSHHYEWKHTHGVTGGTSHANGLPWTTAHTAAVLTVTCCDVRVAHKPCFNTFLCSPAAAAPQQAHLRCRPHTLPLAAQTCLTGPASRRHSPAPPCCRLPLALTAAPAAACPQLHLQQRVPSWC